MADKHLNGSVTNLAEAFRGVILEATAESAQEAMRPVQGEVTSIRRDVTSLLELLVKTESGLNSKIDTFDSHRKQDIENIQVQLREVNKKLGAFSRKLDKAYPEAEPTQAAKKRK